MLRSTHLEVAICLSRPAWHFRERKRAVFERNNRAMLYARLWEYVSCCNHSSGPLELTLSIMTQDRPTLDSLRALNGGR